MSTDALIMLSGGLDSVYNLYAAHSLWGGKVKALFFNYGQKAKESELKAASFFCDHLKIDLQTIDISNIFIGDNSSLTSLREIPTDGVDIESQSVSEETAKSVWVANRNGVFLNVAACLAEKQGIPLIVPGFNKEEAQTFPDNSVEYIEKMNACLKLSTSNGVQIYCFSQNMEKTEILSCAIDLGVDVTKIWSCYHSGGIQCGRCESCQRFQRALKAQGV